jgi:hypothetical protein
LLQPSSAPEAFDAPGKNIYKKVHELKIVAGPCRRRGPQEEGRTMPQVRPRTKAAKKRLLRKKEEARLKKYGVIGAMIRGKNPGRDKAKGGR